MDSDAVTKHHALLNHHGGQSQRNSLLTVIMILRSYDYYQKNESSTISKGLRQNSPTYR